MPRPLPAETANDPGYLALQLWGLSDLVRAAASDEDHLTPSAAFFVAATLDDVSVRLTRQ